MHRTAYGAINILPLQGNPTPGHLRLHSNSDPPEAETESVTVWGYFFIIGFRFKMPRSPHENFKHFLTIVTGLERQKTVKIEKKGKFD